VSWDFQNKKVVLQFSPHIQKQIRKIKDKNFLKRLNKQFKLFQQNPFHNSLRFKPYHASGGNYWEISITMSYRVIMELEETEGSYIFTVLAMGEHDILKKFNP